MDLDNNEIVNGIVAGDRKVLEWCYNHIRPTILGHILKNSGNEEEANTTFRLALMKARENIISEKYVDNGKIQAYVFSIARNQWLYELRKKKNKKQRETALSEQEFNIADGGQSPLEQIIASEEIRKLHKCIGMLGEKCKNLFQLHYFEEYSLKEIAGQLKMEASAIRKRHFDCKKKLERVLLAN